MRKLGLIVIITIWTLIALWALLVFQSAVDQNGFNLTDSFNKGYLEGRLDAFGEMYLCEGVRDEAVVEGYFATIRAIKRSGEAIEGFHCGE